MQNYSPTELQWSVTLVIKTNRARLLFLCLLFFSAPPTPTDPPPWSSSTPEPSFWASGDVFSDRSYEHQQIGVSLALSANSLFSNLANKQLLWREGAKKQMSTLPSLRVPSLNPPLEALSPFFKQRAQFEFIHRLHPTSIGWQCLDSAPWKHCQVLKDLWRCFSIISQGVSSEDKKAKLPGMKAIIKQKVDKLKIK